MLFVVNQRISLIKRGGILAGFGIVVHLQGDLSLECRNGVCGQIDRVGRAGGRHSEFRFGDIGLNLSVHILQRTARCVYRILAVLGQQGHAELGRSFRRIVILAEAQGELVERISTQEIGLANI